MKYAFLFALSLMVFSGVGVAQRGAQTDPCKSDKAAPELKITSVKNGDSELTLRIEVSNRSASPIFLATDPVQFDRTHGYYVSLSGSNRNVVVIESRVFSGLFPKPYSDDTMVKLAKLAAGEQYADIAKLRWPLAETVPPVNTEFRLVALKKSAVTGIEVKFGYFCEEPSIISLLRFKPNGWFVSGEESLPNDHTVSLYEKQKLLTAFVDLSTVH